LISATSGRFIKIKRGIIGGFQMNDFRWQDIAESKIAVGIFGADIIIKIFNSTDLSISKNYASVIRMEGFDKEQLQKVYRIAQTQDQSWREKRRIRELEELRAKAGGINVGNPSTQPTSSNNHDDVVERLRKAKEMLDTKLITDSEYESINARIISSL
jgi:hypothetical protein